MSAAESQQPSAAASVLDSGNSSTDVIAEEKATAIDPSQDPRTVRPIHGFKWLVALFAVYTTAFLYGLDTTIAADVQPAIVESLGSIEKLAWIGVGFPLGSVAVILPLGAAYGLANTKWLYMASIVVFEVGSALCGAAPNMDALIVGRVIAGAGGSGIYLGLLTYISVFTTLHERPMYMALTGLVWGIGTVLGPVIGGAFAVSGATWRWAFYINLVVAAVLAPAFFLYLPQFQPRQELSIWNKLTQFDWVGVVLIAAVFVTYVLALTFGGTQWAWNDGRFIAMIIVFGVLLITFIAQQYFSVFTKKDRKVFPAQFLRSRSLVLLYFGTASAATSLFIGAYFIPLYFQFARNDSAIMAAVRLLPFITMFVVFNLLNGALMPLWFYWPWYVISGIFMITGGALMYTVNSNTSVSQVYGYSVLLAIGSGVTCQAGYAISAAKVSAHDHTQVPAVIGFQNLAQLGSIVIALTISGTIFQNLGYKHLATALAGKGFSPAELHSALSGTQSVIFQQGSDEVKKAAVEAITEAIRNVYILAIVAGVVTLLSSVGLKREKLFMKVVAGG